MLNASDKKSLVEAAVTAQKSAYAPYSQYAVGASVMADDGAIFTGANVENAVYPLTLCAERVAIFKAVSEGCKLFKAIAVVTRNGGSPCGSCRQVMREFSQDLEVIIANEKGDILHETTLDALLPLSFGPEDLT